MLARLLPHFSTFIKNIGWSQAELLKKDSVTVVFLEGFPDIIMAISSAINELIMNCG